MASKDESRVWSLGIWERISTMRLQLCQYEGINKVSGGQYLSNYPLVVISVVQSGYPAIHRSPITVTSNRTDHSHLID